LNFDEIYEKVKSAVTLEIKYSYINFDGRKTNFSSFMIEILKETLKKINKIEKQNTAILIELFEQYKNDDVNHRKYTIDKTLEFFARLRKLIKPQKTPSIKPDEKKEFQEEIEDIDVAYVKGVGPKLAKLFNKMGIFKVKDLIEYYPKKYVDYVAASKIKNLKLGEQVTLYGTISGVKHYTTPKKLTILTIYIKDSTGILPVNFFYKTNNRKLIEHYKSLYPVNSNVMVLGKVKFDEYNRTTTLDKAQIQIIGSMDIQGAKNKIVPIYSLCENLNPKTLTNAIQNALLKFQDKIYDPIPSDIIKELDFIDKKTAIIDIHNPKTNDEIERSRTRLAFDELFSMQLNLALIRKENNKNDCVKLKIKKNGLVDKFIKNLPFELTKGQKKAIDEIIRDLNSKNPMQRLLQGDVGSGKTVVATVALLCAIENGYQGAIMAPTEILATQHFKNFSDWLTPLGLSVGLFCGKDSAKTRKEARRNLKNGQMHVAVGTHALIQEGVEFNNLGVIVIDEQHRFGVR